MNTLSTLSSLPQSKEEIQNYVQDAKQEILKNSGNKLLEIWIQIKSFLSVIKELESDQDIKNLVLESAGENGKSFDFKNAKFSIKQVTKYDYSGCNDILLAKYEKELSDLKERISARQKMLQLLTNPVIDGDFEITPPTKIVDEIVSVTIK